MIRKFTLLSIVVFATILSFGQNLKYTKHSGVLKPGTDRIHKILEEYGIQSISEHLSLKFANFSNKPDLKNSHGLKQKLDSIVSQDWYEETNEWMSSYGQEFLYDSNENLIEYLVSEMDDDTNTMVPQLRNEYTYNSQGLLVQEVNFMWNYFEMEEWNPFQTIDYSYDSEGKLIRQREYFMNFIGNELIALGESEYVYDDNGFLVQIIYNDLYEDPNDPVLAGKVDLLNDEEGNVLMREDFYWNDFDSLWIPNFKDVFLLNAKGNPTNYEYYMWNQDTEQYISLFRMEYTYDSMDNMSQSLSYSWDEDSGQWIADFKEECEYDNSYAYQDLILPFIYTQDPEIRIYFNHKLNDVNGYIWDEEVNDWVIDFKGIAYFSEPNTSSINEIKLPEPIVYPNPFKDNISFLNLDKYHQIQFELFDSQGRKILSEKLGSNEIIHTESLASGVYYFNLILDGEIHNGKIVNR